MTCRETRPQLQTTAIMQQNWLHQPSYNSACDNLVPAASPEESSPSILVNSVNTTSMSAHLCYHLHKRDCISAALQKNQAQGLPALICLWVVVTVLI